MYVIDSFSNNPQSKTDVTPDFCELAKMKPNETPPKPVRRLSNSSQVNRVFRHLNTVTRGKPVYNDIAPEDNYSVRFLRNQISKFEVENLQLVSQRILDRQTIEDLRVQVGNIGETEALKKQISLNGVIIDELSDVVKKYEERENLTNSKISTIEMLFAKEKSELMLQVDTLRKEVESLKQNISDNENKYQSIISQHENEKFEALQKQKESYEATLNEMDLKYKNLEKRYKKKKKEIRTLTDEKNILTNMSQIKSGPEPGVV